LHLFDTRYFILLYCLKRIDLRIDISNASTYADHWGKSSQFILKKVYKQINKADICRAKIKYYANITRHNIAIYNEIQYWIFLPQDNLLLIMMI